MIYCTFAGHREILHAGIERRVMEIIEEMLKADSDFCFFSGGMGQFDRLCERCVRQLRSSCPEKQIRLILVEPYMKQSINTEGEHLRKLYDDILIPEELLGIHYKSAITLRNRWMINHSCDLITYIRHDHGGAFAMLQYAKKQNLRIHPT